MMEETEKTQSSEAAHETTSASRGSASSNASPNVSSHANPNVSSSPSSQPSPTSHSGGKSSIKKIVVAVVVLVIGAVAISYAPNMIKGGGDHSQSDKKKVRMVPVTVATAGIQTVPIEVRSIGNVLAFSTVNVTPQVGGQLTKVYFTQGQLVKKNDLLFQIDPRQYQAALAQAEGNVAKDRAMIQSAMANLTKDQATIGQFQFNLKKDKASLAYANLEKGRYAMLVDQGVVSHEQSDQYNTNAATADATIQADMKTIENAKAVVQGDQAAIDTAKGSLEADQGVADNARLQLSWCTIKSPMDGRTSSLSVYQGNIVNATTMQPLCSIVQVDPIYVTVAVPEQYLNDLRRAQQSNTLKLQALIEGRKTDSVNGTISFMENTVNTSTGTISMRASYANADGRLYPGQFVDVLISMPPKGPTVTIPTKCVQNTQQGTSVYIVQADKTVKLTTIKAGQASGDFTAVQDGVNVGDIVVTDGQLQLSPGVKVKIQKSHDQPKPPDQTSADQATSAGQATSPDQGTNPGQTTSSGQTTSPGQAASPGHARSHGHARSPDEAKSSGK
jgi:multidrug efflux system membrane fusion protein